jgi:glycosyltransferase involved in cell wall biosynthesis
MKIALLHYSFWPEIGGVEQVMRDQANMLHRAGHQVRVISGISFDPGDGYRVELIPELAPDYALNIQVQSVLERGQADQNFNRYRALLVQALKLVLAEVELTLVHNVFTMHHNLALTRALHDIAPDHRMVAWTHDLAATNSDYALPNPTQPPWNLMRTSSPHVTYVAISDLRAKEVEAQLKPSVAPQVIPNPVDPIRLFGLSPEMAVSYASLMLPERDFVFLLPAQVMPRKNIDFAIEAVKQIRVMGQNPLLLITGAPVPRSPSSQRYGDFLRDSLPEELEGHVIFVSDFFAVIDEILRDLYLLADCLLFPSGREGFGLPVIEAAMFRLPVWCRDVPAFEAIKGDGAAFLLNDLAKVSDAMAWLETQPHFRQQRRCRRLFDPSEIYRQHYEPLFGSLKLVTPKGDAGS